MYFGVDNNQLIFNAIAALWRRAAIVYIVVAVDIKHRHPCHSHDKAQVIALEIATGENQVIDLDNFKEMTFNGPSINIEQTDGDDILDMREMTCTCDAWADWIECDNEYATGDRAAVEAGALDYLNTIAVRLRRLSMVARCIVCLQVRIKIRTRVISSVSSRRSNCVMRFSPLVIC